MPPTAVSQLSTGSSRHKPGIVILRTLLASATLLGAIACGGAAQTMPDALSESNDATVIIAEIDYEPMVIMAGSDDDGNITSTVTDIQSLFFEANDYLRADDYDNAIRLYRIVIAESDHDDYRRATSYNLALSYDGIDDPLRAARWYQEVANSWPGSEEGLFSLFGLAENAAAIGEWREVPPLMERALGRTDMEHVDRVEANLRWATALLETRQFADAEERFNTVLSLNAQAWRTWDPTTSDASMEPVPNHDAIIAAAHFGLGRVYHELFSEIRLVLPREQLTQDMVDKSQLFSQAEQSYLDCVRTGNVTWAPIAGHRVGELYEDFYYDVLASEIPESFNELELEIYWEALRDLIGMAMERALSVYEHNLAMSYRMGSAGDAVDDTIADIVRLQAYIIMQEGWEDEQDAIFRRRHPRSAFYTDGLEFRAD